MRIKFKAPDPRAGTIAQMDSSRGQYFIDTGAAVQMKDGDREESGNPGSTARTAPVRADLDTALATLPGGNHDPEYVVRMMRSHFGELFTEDDEAKVREVVKPAVRMPSEGLTIDEIKAALDVKRIAIPAGVKLRADLAALLDAAPSE